MAPVMKGNAEFNFAVESDFAKKLASNIPKIRKKAVKSLKNWFSNRANSGLDFKEDELMRFWKGLFYCMWMCDKAIVQEELAENISGLMSSFSSIDELLRFVDAFLKTMAREWFSIDRFRIEKFLMLVRRMMRSLFVFVFAQKGRKVMSIRKMNDMLSKFVLSGDSNINCPLGLSTHIIDLYLEEIKYTSKGKLTPKMILKLVTPFCELLTRSKNKTLLSLVNKSIFDVILDDTAFHRMEKMDAAKSSSQGSDDDYDSDEDLEYITVKCDKFELHNRKDIPAIDFDCLAIAKLLLNLSRKMEIPTKNRKICYGTVKRLKSAARGHDSLVSSIRIEDYNPEEMQSNFDSALDRLMDDFKEDKAMKKEWKVYQKSVSDSARRNMAQKRPHTNSENEETFAKRTKKSKNKKNEIAGHSKANYDDERESIELEKEMTDDTEEEIPFPAKKPKVGKKFCVEDEMEKNLATEEKSTKQKANNKKNKKQKGRYFSEEIPTPKLDEQIEDGEIEIFIPNKKYNGKLKGQNKSSVDSFAKFEKVKKTPPVFLRRTMRKVQSATIPSKQKKLTNLNLTMTPNTTRKVNFVLEKNKAQEHHDYTLAIKNSPITPFDAKKRPNQGVLKRRF